MLDLHFDPSDVTWLLLILVRVSAVIFVMPLFGAKFLPTQWKVGFSVVVSVLISMVLEAPEAGGENLTAGWLFFAAAGEAVQGLIIGLATGFIFYAVMLWGQVIGAQMGLGVANIFDPQSGMDISVISKFYYMFAIVVFLSIDGHHLLMNGILDSYRFFPLGTVSFPFRSMETFVDQAGNIFTVAVQLAASMIVLMLLVSTVLGVIARTVPQMNIFIVGFPLKLFVGLTGMVVSVPYITRALIDLFRKLPTDLALILGS